MSRINHRAHCSVGRTLAILSVVIATGSIVGCAGHMTLSHEVNLTSSNAIFLTPSEEKTIYLQNRNTSDNPNINFAELPNKIKAKGYAIVDNPDKAQYILQSQVVLCNKLKPGQTVDALIAGGFGGAIGVAAGSAAALSGASLSQIPILGAVGAVGGFAASKFSEDSIVACVVDAMVQERTKEEIQQSVTTNSMPVPGTPQSQPGAFGFLNQQSVSPPQAGQVTQQISEIRKGTRRFHQARIVASDQKMWLSVPEASKILSDKLEDSLAGLF